MRPTVVLVSAAVAAVLLTCAALFASAGGNSAPDVAFPEVVPATSESPVPEYRPVVPEPKPEPKPNPSPRDPFKPSSEQVVRNALRKAAGGATVSAQVFDRRNGTSLFEEVADRRFRSASLVKLMIAIDALDRGTHGPTSTKMTQMLSLSHDAAASEMWVAGGGSKIVRRVAAKLGLNAEPPQPEGRWGNTMITARDVVKIYDHILDAAPELMPALRSAPAIAADGFDQHFGIPRALNGLPWAIKQGWAAGGGSMDLHTTGVIGDDDRFIVVVLTKSAGGANWGWGSRMTTEATLALRPLLVR
ncbi:class A beta-lactamase-related serine hydrolase [Allokutzneria sp. A3M-2-11 16]|uniref:class A beta-lactamase-related serine hydrolase n=1 Tax=Allokutzneria sp. A3M-2-11 16 TaxID=2962043 RepID=UPI0020B6AA50|nr:class A beta-lactamase-related serine hydrolase [Allokutzneria sp. A3M-2-11 16]MCP3798287.1 class A beta-lactamase-related serine hydrolase [Allokutzneria sp. A3M-2-11 16]